MTYAVPYFEMQWAWISEHWDLHLEGLCRFEGALAHFKTDVFDPEFIGGEGGDLDGSDAWYRPEPICLVTPLSPLGKLRWLWRKRLFELCVGYHWTYSGGKRAGHYYLRRPKALYRLIEAIYYRKISRLRTAG